MMVVALLFRSFDLPKSILTLANVLEAEVKCAA